MHLNPADDAFAARLRDALPEATFREAEPRFTEEPRGRHHGTVGLVLAPASTEEVATVVRQAAEARVPVIPYGGGTGLVAGQLSDVVPAPVIVSLERMSAVRAVHPDENVLIAEAGAILADIHAAADDANRLFPLSYASQGTARIGGALSVNSGGINVLRYGTARDLCLGLEAVLPDGSVWHGLKRLRKDNTGYDLRNLLIGAEGTLGIITAASLRLFPRPEARATALLAVPSPFAALELFHRANPSGLLTAFELISGQGAAFMDETGVDARTGLDPFPDWAVLLELTGAKEDAPQHRLESLFASAHDAGEVTDGVLASSEAQRAALWHFRESLPEGNRRIGAIASHDISLPLSRVPDFIDEAPARIAAIAPVRINVFGHMGDGNLHYNIFPLPGEVRSAYAGQADDLTRAIHDLVAEMGGSFSAEHGIGRLKTADLQHYGDPAKLAAMRAIKAALDPAGIMNPGAVLPLP